MGFPLFLAALSAPSRSRIGASRLSGSSRRDNAPGGGGQVGVVVLLGWVRRQQNALVACVSVDSNFVQGS
jgi:hypothetical protein